MLTIIMMIAAGVIILYLGAEGLVRGACHLAKRFNIAPLVIGLTVVACGTSLPETVVNLVAQMRGGLGDIIIGNIVGSNISNIGLVLGASIILTPLTITSSISRREMPVLLIVCFSFFACLLTGTITRAMGIAFVVALIAYLLYHYKNARRKYSADDVLEESLTATPLRSTAFSIAIVVIGSIALFFGARLLVEGATRLAVVFSVPQRIIALTVVALGTSLPELATSMIAASRRHHSISIGNVIGSIIFNILFATGAIACIRDISFSMQLAYYDATVMLAFVIVMAILLHRKRSLPRSCGIALRAAYALYLAAIVSI